jgi:hypothetical protein
MGTRNIGISTLMPVVWIARAAGIGPTLGSPD